MNIFIFDINIFRCVSILDFFVGYPCHRHQRLTISRQWHIQNCHSCFRYIEPLKQILMPFSPFMTNVLTATTGTSWFSVLVSSAVDRGSWEIESKSSDGRKFI